MMEKVKGILAFALMFLLLACVRDVNVMSLTEKQYPPSQNIETLTSKASKPYIEIASLELFGGTFATWEDMKKQMTAKAKTIGADGIMSLKMKRTGENEDGYKKLTGIAFRYK